MSYYEEDTAEERIASMPREDQHRWWPDGMSAPEGYNPPEYNTKPDTGLSQPLPQIVYVDPNVLLYDALRHLFAIASECPEIVNHCRGTLDEARDALEIAKAFQLAKGAR